jgi:hypothetical protein
MDGDATINRCIRDADEVHHSLNRSQEVKWAYDVYLMHPSDLSHRGYLPRVPMTEPGNRPPEDPGPKELPPEPRTRKELQELPIKGIPPKVRILISGADQAPPVVSAPPAPSFGEMPADLFQHIQELEEWVSVNKADARRDTWAFWALKLPAIFRSNRTKVPKVS